MAPRSKIELTGPKAFLIVMSIGAGIAVFISVAYETEEYLGEETYYRTRTEIGGCTEGFVEREVPYTREKTKERLKFNAESAPIATLAALITAILYPFLSALFMYICERLRSWAHKGVIQTWTVETRIVLAAIWPVTLLCSVILYVFLGTINRIFAE